jgi:hypothetical protein
LSPSDVATPSNKRTAPSAWRGGFDRGAFYRLCRMLHAYMSAFAFLALIFFSATGLLLDHPEWMQGRARESAARLTLPAAVTAEARGMKDPSPYLAVETAKRTDLLGRYKSGEVDDGLANLRFEGVKGASTVTVDLATGQADISVEHPTALTVIGDLHRGKNASVPWRAVIDITAILVLVMSLIGYVLFFSLRFRLKTSLILTGASLAVLVAIFVWLTP